MRRFFLLLLLLPLLFSCSSERKAYYLEAESESVAYLVDGSTMVVVHVPRWVMLGYGEYSGLEGVESFESLFGRKASSYACISDENFMRRSRLFEILRKETGSEDAIHAYANFRKDLRKTDFIDTMNSLSSSFEDGRLAREIRSGTHVYEYDLDSVLSKTAPWDRQKAFLDLWIEAILRNV